MEKFLGNKRVKLVRSFMVNGVNYSELDDKTVVVTTDLKDERVFSIAKKGEDEMVSHVQKGNKSTTLTQSANGITIEGNKLVLEGEVEITDELPAADVYAVNAKGRQTKLGVRPELAESAQVKRLKLDPEAIVRTLDGKQKQHKGYTFITK